MAVRHIWHDEIGEVALQKRRGSKSIRLKLNPSGKVVVTLPYFVPYKTAERFLHQHTVWVLEQQAKRPQELPEGMLIGRAHTLRYIQDPTARQPRTRVTVHEVIVRHATRDISDPAIQAAAKRAALRALRQEAVTFLPRRLENIATREGYEYSSVVVKQMRSRWGSCNQDKRITLNIFLLQLPIELIDYVILHELAHTKELHHGTAFWQEFEAHLPNARELRGEMKRYQPILVSQAMA